MLANFPETIPVAHPIYVMLEKINILILVASKDPTFPLIISTRPRKKTTTSSFLCFVLQDFAPKHHLPNRMAPPAPRDPSRASQRNPRSHGAADGAEAAKDDACGAERMESALKVETPAPGT